MKSAGLLDPPLKKLLFNALLTALSAACCGPNLVLSSVLDVRAPALSYFDLAVMEVYQYTIREFDSIYVD